MINSQIRQQAKEIMFKNIGLFAVAFFGARLISSFFESLAKNNVLLTIAYWFISSVISIGIACFNFRAFNRGVPDISDLYTLFTESHDNTKMMKLVLIQFGLNSIIMILAFAIASFGSFFTLLSSIFLITTTILIELLPFLYISNPNYPMDYYIKRLSKYIIPEIFRYMGFVLVTALPIRLLLIVASLFLALIPIIGLITVAVLSVAYNAYVNLAAAGFVSSIIPPEWYSGNPLL